MHDENRILSNNASIGNDVKYELLKKARKKANVKYLDRQLTLPDVNKSINKLYF